MKTDNLYFKGKHLNAIGKALYADGMKLQLLEQLPQSMINHVNSCLRCHAAVVDAYLLVKDVPVESILPHPYFQT